MNAPKLIVGTIFAAIIGFLIVVPLYDILQGVLEFNPFVLLGVGLIAAVVFIKIYTGLGNRISIPMIVGAGIFFIALGLLTSSAAAAGDGVGDDGSGTTEEETGGSAYYGSTAAVMAVAVSWIGLVGLTRSRRQHSE